MTNYKSVRVKSLSVSQFRAWICPLSALLEKIQMSREGLQGTGKCVGNAVSRLATEFIFTNFFSRSFIKANIVLLVLSRKKMMTYNLLISQNQSPQWLQEKKNQHRQKLSVIDLIRNWMGNALDLKVI